MPNPIGMKASIAEALKAPRLPEPTQIVTIRPESYEYFRRTVNRSGLLWRETIEQDCFKLQIGSVVYLSFIKGGAKFVL